MTTIEQVRGPAGWRGDDLAGGTQWTYTLDDAGRRELREAVERADSAGVPLDEVRPAAFPLPTLAHWFRRLAHDLTHGRGFVLLRGLPVDGLTERQCELLALGVGGHVGEVVPQGPRGLPLLHVRDSGADPAQPGTRSYQHRHRLGFHADPTDVVALLCLRPARSGGLSTIVSAVAVHDELVRTRPDLVEVLYQPWWYDRRAGDGPESFVQQPVYQRDAAGRLVSRYGPDYIRSAQRGANVPPLTPAQLAAMKALDDLTVDPRFVLTMDLRPGDMQFLHNAVVLHGRTAYDDHPEPERRRDLVRLWLADLGRA